MSCQVQTVTSGWLADRLSHPQSQLVTFTYTTVQKAVIVISVNTHFVDLYEICSLPWNFRGHKSMFTVTASFQFNNGTVTVAEYCCMWRFRKSLIWGTLKPGVRWYTKVTQSGSGLILCGVILQGMLTNTLGAQRSGQPTSKHFWSNDLILGTCTCQLTGHLGMV